MPVGLKEVAQLAGVSVRTVSNVVNDYPYVTEATRARVRRALDELNYRPNLAARSLRTGRSGILALAVPAIDAPYFGELARHIVKAAERHSYTVLIEHTDGLSQRERGLFADGGSHLIDGLILSPVALRPRDLRARVDNIPLVLLGEPPDLGIADHVAIDNLAAARTATAHLLQIGRRRIAAIGCQQAASSVAEHLRYRGCAAALRDAGVAVERRLVVPAQSLDRPGGARAMEQLLALNDPPDAVFCSSDLVALGAIRTLLDRGYRVPEDVAVVGIDDIEDGRFSTPSLTTIAPDKAQIANLVVELLLSRVKQGNTKPPRKVQADYALVIRESSVGRVSR
jgi:LacI family transcriptional regulator, repressor for deo operon, udp, cdd, tsx, nupC, and nupG